MSIHATRSRWAAIGAAVAVSLGAGGIGISHATTSTGERPVYIPLDAPCRLADNRPAGIGPDTSVTFDGWGTVGDCTLPTGTAGLALNVTAVDATQQTNLRFYPADVAVPGTANLNPTPGAPPIPNAVNVALSSSGEFKVYNRFGTVAVVIDVMGVYDDHNHDDRYYQKAEVDAELAGVETELTSIDTRVTALEAAVAPLVNSVGAYAKGADLTDLTSTDEVMVSVTISAPANGTVLVTSSAYLFNSVAGSARCSITPGTAIDFDWLQFAEHIASDGATIAGTRGFDVTSGQLLTVNLVCDEFNGDTTMRIPSLTAIFAPT